MDARWFLACAILVAGSGSLVAHAQQLDWWQTTVFYQVYPRSFQDSDGDGTGDLIGEATGRIPYIPEGVHDLQFCTHSGITSRLVHLKEMGVGAMWMSPIFTSPMADFGYDIADFKAIDPLFGTMQDFEDLVAKAKELGIKVILDFVPNHTSDEHDWFVKSLANDPDYADYYVWKDPSGIDDEGKPIPPNNWISAFYGPAWTYREERGQFYLHQYDPKQPDLNYRESRLVQDMKDVLTYWLDKGVDGFRVDAIAHAFEDARFLDEPRSNDTSALPGDPTYLEHVYTTNQPETIAMVKEWRALLDDYSRKDNNTRVMMTEVYADIDTTMLYYGDAENPGAHFTFNFGLIKDLNRNSSAQDFADYINHWMDKMPAGATANWVAGNHDRKRVATRYGLDMADGITMLIQLLPGVGVTYNGEEIGMLDTFISWEDTQDPKGCGAGPDRYQDVSRDPSRTPFQWDGSKNAGFSTANKTWLPVNENYVTLNLANQKAQSVSHYNVYKRVLEARQSETIQRGSLTTRVLGEKVIAYSRELEGHSLYLVVVNLGNNTEIVDLRTPFGTWLRQCSVVTASVDSHLVEGDAVALTAVPLHPKSGLVLSETPSFK